MDSADAEKEKLVKIVSEGEIEFALPAASTACFRDDLIYEFDPSSKDGKRMSPVHLLIG